MGALKAGEGQSGPAEPHPDYTVNVPKEGGPMIPDCGCSFSFRWDEPVDTGIPPILYDVTYCPLHKSAGKLLKALEAALEWAGEDFHATWALKAREAIKEARGARRV